MLTTPERGGPVSIAFARRVKPGRAGAYKAWVAAFQEGSRQVEGFLGATTIGRGDAGDEYISVVKFDSFESLRAWEESDSRRAWLAKLPADAVAGEAEIRRLDGLEFWFTAPGVAAPVAPSPHRMALVLVAVIFLLGSGLTPLLRATLADAPGPLRSLVMVVAQVVLMTYVIMPRVTKLLAGWLFRR